MSTKIQQLLCSHDWQKENDITLICKKCGKIKQIPCCHKWQSLIAKHNEGYNVFGLHYSIDANILVCEKCGEIRTIYVEK